MGYWLPVFGVRIEKERKITTEEITCKFSRYGAKTRRMQRENFFVGAYVILYKIVA